jgi:hypothetical protein
LGIRRATQHQRFDRAKKGNRPEAANRHRSEAAASGAVVMAWKSTRDGESPERR